MILSACILLPLAAAAAMVLTPRERPLAIKLTGVAACATSLLLATVMLADIRKDGLGDSAFDVFTAQVDEVLREVAADPRHPDRQRLEHELNRHPLPDDPALEELAARLTARSRTHAQVYEDALELSLAARSPQAKQLRFVEYRPWVPAFQISYLVGVDGLSLPLVWLAALVGLALALHSWREREAVKGTYVLLLVATAGLIGSFAALDLFLLLAFVQLAVIPVFFLAGGWLERGRAGEARPAALSSLLAVQLACLLLALVTIVAVFAPADLRSFNLLALCTLAGQPEALPAELQAVAYISLLAACALLMPIFPLHSWQSPAFCHAPGGAGALLAGVTLPLGGYMLLRLGSGLCPESMASEWGVTTLSVLGLVGLLHGGLCAMAQPQLGAMLAYVRLSQAGLVLLGIAAMTEHSLAGAVLHLSGLWLAGALLCLATAALGRRSGGTNRAQLAGSGRSRPALATMSVLGLLALMGAPLLPTFVSQLLVLMGTWGAEPFGLAAGRAGSVPPWAAGLGLIGMVLAAATALPWAQTILLPAPQASPPPMTGEPPRSSTRRGTRSFRPGGGDGSASGGVIAGASAAAGGSASSALPGSSHTTRRAPTADPRPQPQPAREGAGTAPSGASSATAGASTALGASGAAFGGGSTRRAGDTPSRARSAVAAAPAAPLTAGDLDVVEFLGMAPLVAVALLLGVLPQVSLGLLQPVVHGWLQVLGR